MGRGDGIGALPRRLFESPNRSREAKARRVLSNYVTFLADTSIAYDALGPKTTVRYGQFFFNELLEVRPDIAEKLRGTVMDPFQRNNVPPQVHEFVEELWDRQD